MTLIDLINTWNLEHDVELDNFETFFAGCTIDNRLDRGVVIGTILDECGSMKPLYNVSGTFKWFTENWFKKYQWNIGKLCDTLDFEYNPLRNKWSESTDTVMIDQNLKTDEDVTESSERDNTGTRTVADTGTQRTDNTGTQKTNDTGTQRTNDTGTQRTEYGETTENTISAMNSGTYQPDNNSVMSGDSERTDDLESLRTDNLESLRTDNLESLRTDNLESLRTDNLKEVVEKANGRDKEEVLDWDETDTHAEEGMSGSTTYQDLIEKERKIAQFSVYNWIAKKFASEMFLLVY